MRTRCPLVRLRLSKPGTFPADNRPGPVRQVFGPELVVWVIKQLNDGGPTKTIPESEPCQQTGINTEHPTKIFKINVCQTKKAEQHLFIDKIR